MTISAKVIKQEQGQFVAELTATEDGDESVTIPNPLGTDAVHVQFEPVAHKGPARDAYDAAKWKTTEHSATEITAVKLAAEGSSSDTPQVRMYVRADAAELGAPVAAKAKSAAKKPAKRPGAKVPAGKPE